MGTIWATLFILNFIKDMMNDKDPTPELLTPNELADMLKISKRGVYRLMAQRKIRFYKIIGSIRFKKDDVIAFLKDNRVDIIE